MPATAAHIAKAMASSQECVGCQYRGNETCLPGTGVWEMRMD